MKNSGTRIAIILGAMSLLSFPVESPIWAQESEPSPVTSPQDITGGDYPPEHYVVLPVPRGELEAVNKTPLLHKDVLDEHGKKLGMLEKLIEDGRLIPLPWTELKTTRKKNAVVISSTQPRLETAAGETAKEIKALMRPGMLSDTHIIMGQVQKIVGGDYVLKDSSGERMRVHVENGTKMNRVPNVGDKIKAKVNDYDTAMVIETQ